MATRQQGNKLPGDSTATLLGPEIQVVGRIEGREELTIQGYVEGSVHLTEVLLIDKEGVVVADVRALDVIVHGIVVGNIVAERRIVLQAGARVVGDLKAPRISIAGGAALRGQVMMGSTADEGEREESGGHRSGSGSGSSRWRSSSSRGVARGTVGGTVGGGGRSRVTRSASAKPSGVLARRTIEQEEPGPRHPPLRKRIVRDIERSVGPEQVAIDSLEPESHEDDGIDVDDGVVGVGGAKKQAARPRVPARGKHTVDHA